jgi:GTP-binding protein LepA
LPDPNKLEYVEEPYIKAQVITKSDYIGAIMTLCIEKRGMLTNQVYLTSDRIELTFEMPLAEIVFDFYDRLKTISKGYASFDYFPIGMQQSDLVKMDILLTVSIIHIRLISSGLKALVMRKEVRSHL